MALEYSYVVGAMQSRWPQKKKSIPGVPLHLPVLAYYNREPSLARLGDKRKFTISPRFYSVSRNVDKLRLGPTAGNISSPLSYWWMRTAGYYPVVKITLESRYSST
jgi:hypothetical protein